MATDPPVPMTSEEVAEHVRGWNDTVDRPCPRCRRPRPVIARVLRLYPGVQIPPCEDCVKGRR